MRIFFEHSEKSLWYSPNSAACGRQRDLGVETTRHGVRAAQPVLARVPRAGDDRSKGAQRPGHGDRPVIAGATGLRQP